MISPNGELATDVVACAAVTSHLWMPHLQTASATSAELVPILGATWLFIQSTRALIQAYLWWANRKHKHKS